MCFWCLEACRSLILQSWIIPHDTLSACLPLSLCPLALSFLVHLPATAPSSQVKGKTSKVDVFAPSLATDVAAALTLPSPPPASRAAGLSPAAVGSAPSAPVPAGVILAGLGGGGIRISPPPPLAPVPLPPFPQPESLSTAGVGAAEKTIRTDDDDVPLSRDDSKRYRLESPRKGTWNGGARRGNEASMNGSSGGETGLWRQ